MRPSSAIKNARKWRATDQPSGGPMHLWMNARVIRGAPSLRVMHKGAMIVTEHGLTFARTDDAWRCVERPELLMIRCGCYRIEGREQYFPTLAAALAAEMKSEQSPREPRAAGPTRGYRRGY